MSPRYSRVGSRCVAERGSAATSWPPMMPPWLPGPTARSSPPVGRNQWKTGSLIAEPEVPAQGRGRVLGAQHPALLQQRHDGVHELVEAAGDDVRHEDEPVRGVVLDELVDGRGHRRRGADERLPAGDL